MIAAAGDGPVVFDGTIPVDGRWTEDTGGRFRTNPPVPVYQMFAARKSGPSGDLQMQVPARWPNARFDDRSCMLVQSALRSAKVRRTRCGMSSQPRAVQRFGDPQCLSDLVRPQPELCWP